MAETSDLHERDDLLLQDPSHNDDSNNNCNRILTACNVDSPPAPVTNAFKTDHFSPVNVVVDDFCTLENLTKECEESCALFCETNDVADGPNVISEITERHATACNVVSETIMSTAAK